MSATAAALLSGLAGAPAAARTQFSAPPQFAPTPTTSGLDRSVRPPATARSLATSRFAPHHPSKSDSRLGGVVRAAPTTPQQPGRSAPPEPAQPYTHAATLAPDRSSDEPLGPLPARSNSTQPAVAPGLTANRRELRRAKHRPSPTNPKPPAQPVRQRVSAAHVPARHVQASALPPLGHPSRSATPWLAAAFGVLACMALITALVRRGVGGLSLSGALATYRRGYARGDAAGSFNLGCLLAERGDALGAIEAFRRADARGDAAGASNLGVLLEQQGETEAAQAAYRRAERRGYAHGSFNLGLLLERRGDVAGALEAYRRAARRGDAEVAKRARAALAELREPAAD